MHSSNISSYVVFPIPDCYVFVMYLCVYPFMLFHLFLIVHLTNTCPCTNGISMSDMICNSTEKVVLRVDDESNRLIGESRYMRGNTCSRSLMFNVMGRFVEAYACLCCHV